MSPNANPSAAARAWKLFRIAAVASAICMALAAVVVVTSLARVSRSEQAAERSRLESQERGEEVERLQRERRTDAERISALQTEVDSIREALGSSEASLRLRAEELGRANAEIERLAKIESATKQPWRVPHNSSPLTGAGSDSALAIVLRSERLRASADQNQPLVDEVRLRQVAEGRLRDAGIELAEDPRANSLVVDLRVRSVEAQGRGRVVSVTAKPTRASLNPGDSLSWSWLQLDSIEAIEWSPGTTSSIQDIAEKLLGEVLESLLRKIEGDPPLNGS